MTGRLPWFRCFPSKLLGALAGLDADEQLVYLTVLLRIYEVGGPANDTPRALSLRTSLSTRRVTEALQRLVKAGKIIRAEGGLFNEVAAREITERRSVIETKKQNRSKRGQNIEQIQRNDLYARATPDQRPAGDLHLHLEKKERADVRTSAFQSGPLEAKAASKGKKRGSKTALPENWAMPVEWRSYPRSKGIEDAGINREAEKFEAYARRNDARYVDWFAAWRMWITNAIGYDPKLVSNGAYTNGHGAEPTKEQNEKMWRVLLEREAETGVWQSREVRKSDIPPEFISKWKADHEASA